VKNKCNNILLEIGHTMRVIGVDPGVVNCAASVFDITKTTKGISIKYIASFMMTTTICDNTDESAHDFERYCKKLKRKYKPDLLVIERMVPRGNFLRGSIIEHVNWMIHELRRTLKCQTRPVMAASWKNSYKRVDLKSLYKIHKKSVTAHQIDSCLMILKQFDFDIAKTNRLLLWLAKNVVKNL
jgi:Poxvirus A22 protein